MVFPSNIALYLDPPNWHQEPNHQHHQLEANNGNSINESGHQRQHQHQLLPPLPPQAQEPQVVGSIRAGSMADRAQVAKIMPPEATLKCPRCESTNTKFCYFNNYSLAQPRHFCKTCRRYWTRGGALRNVPVGGGCRRNKKSKKDRSKSPATLPSTEKHSPPTTILANSAVPTGATCQELIGRFSQPSSNRGFMGQNELMGFQIGGVEQWRLQQFANDNWVVSSCGGSYGFEGVGVGPGDMMGASSTSRVTQHHMMPPFKLEGNGGVNLMRSASHNNNQYYYSSWPDLSALASSAAHLL